MADIVDFECTQGFVAYGKQYSPQELKHFSEQLRVLNLQKEGKLPNGQAVKQEEIKSGFTKPE